jgi:hypothetical protein
VGSADLASGNWASDKWRASKLVQQVALMAVGIGEELGVDVFEDTEGEVGLMGGEVGLDEATGSGSVTGETLEIGLPEAGSGAGFAGGFGEGGGVVEIAVFGLLAE